MVTDFSDRVRSSRTTLTKMVFPNTTNHHSTLFGGTLMEWMDEVGFIVATRFARQRMVTVSMDRIDFQQPIPAGHMVDLVGEVARIGHSSLEVEVSVYREAMYRDERQLAVTGRLTFVAVNEAQRPITLSIHGAGTDAQGPAV